MFKLKYLGWLLYIQNKHYISCQWMHHFSNKAEITPETLSSVSIFVICGSREKYTGSEVKFMSMIDIFCIIYVYEWFWFFVY